MTHEKKIKALIEAGDAHHVASSEYHAAPPPKSAHLRHRADANQVRLSEAAASARESIKLLAEIAEAAGEASGGVDESLMLDDLLAEWNRRWKRLNALLAKYKEAQDAE